MRSGGRRSSAASAPKPHNGGGCETGRGVLSEPGRGASAVQAAAAAAAAELGSAPVRSARKRRTTRGGEKEEAGGSGAGMEEAAPALRVEAATAAAHTTG